MTTTTQARAEELAREWLTKWFAGHTLDYYAKGIAPGIAAFGLRQRLEEHEEVCAKCDDDHNPAHRGSTCKERVDLERQLANLEGRTGAGVEAKS